MPTTNNKKPLVLITRPLVDAMPLAEQLQEQGFDVWIEPMIAIEIKFHQTQSLADILNKPPQAIIITSSNGVRALAELSPERNIQLITVGPASADEAAIYGFTKIDMANPEYGGDVKGLVRYINQNYKAGGGLILHASGQVATGDLIGELKRLGLLAAHIALYDAQTITSLSQTVCDAIKEHLIDLLLFYSPRTASIFAGIVKKYNLSQYFSHTDCYCLSQNIVDNLTEIKFRNVYIAKNPTQEAMLMLINANK